MQDLISIILPTFNRDSTLEKSIRSVLEQNYENWELIIVDDGSTDGTSDLVKKYLEKDSRINFLKLKTNCGACCARNRGMEIAQGKYLTFLDSDDEYFPDKIRKQVEFFQKSDNSNLGVVSCGRIVYKEEKEFKKYLPQKEEKLFLKFVGKRKEIGGSTPLLMVKTSIIRKENVFFDPEMPAMQDWDFLLRICMKNDFDFVPDYLVKVNHHRNERVYNPENAVKAIELQYFKYLDLLMLKPDSHKIFIKRASAKIAHHRSLAYALKFLNIAKNNLKNYAQRIEMNLFVLILISFKVKYFKLFYMKYFNG